MAFNDDGSRADGDEAGGYGDLGGGELDNAADESSAGWGGADYGEQVGSGGFDTAFGWDSPGEVASGMAGAGFSDQDISEALSNQGVGWWDRASLVGPLDAITQGDVTRALSTGLGAAVARVNPLAGLVGSAADQYQRGQLTGNYSGLGGLLGSLAGSYLGGNIGADLGGTLQTAQLGMGLGGLSGKLLGSAIGSGQYGTTAQPRDISQEGGGQTMVVSSRQVQPMQRTQSIAPLMLGGLSSQPAMTYSTGRRFGIV